MEDTFQGQRGGCSASPTAAPAQVGLLQHVLGVRGLAIWAALPAALWVLTWLRPASAT